MKTVIGFFEESEGVKSYARMSSAVLLALVVALILISVIKTQAIDYTLVITLLSFSFGSKLIQKPMEAKPDNNVKPDTDIK
jgi:hypothetical protein